MSPLSPRASVATPWPGLLMAAVGAVAFSGKAVIAKLAYRYGVDAVTLVMYRMLFALPLFLLLSVWASRGKPALERRDGWVVCGLGFSGYYLASTLDFMGLQYVSASLERLILYLNPTLVLAMGVVLFKRHVSARQVIALAVSYGGVLLVFGALRLTGLASTVACVLCLLQFVALRPLSAAMVAPEVIALSLLNAVLCTFAPVVLMMLAIERIGATLAAQTGMIGPMSTIGMSVLLLGEPFTAGLAAGTALVVAGIWLLATWR